ncbi:MAG: aminotransferase class IV [Candidatus Peregrinibacteria bacterium]|nr:aminotransferase class IV [Candidatus Peregrinibacteria bacterium]
MIISINGKLVDEKKACIPVTSEAYLFGYAVFETIRTYNKKVFRLDDHLARLFVSADILGFKPKWTFKKAYEAVVTTLATSKKWKETKIRVILSKEDLIVMVEKIQEKPAEMYKKGVKLVSFHGKRNLPHAKTLADCFSFVAKNYALTSGAYEAVLVDPKTYVRECAYANIFWVNGGEVYTTNKEVLFGITRETVVELAENCKFEGIKFKSLLSADEVFITQTTSGILPVTEINGQKISNGKPGPITKKLMKKFEKLVWGK